MLAGSRDEEDAYQRSMSLTTLTPCGLHVIFQFKAGHDDINHAWRGDELKSPPCRAVGDCQLDGGHARRSIGSISAARNGRAKPGDCRQKKRPRE